MARVVDRFRVERALGAGGTAVVYLVRDVQRDTRHALKVLTVTSPAIRIRMVREGRVQAQLQHPNVVEMHDVLELEGSPALLMEYVNGTTLDAALKRYRLTTEDAELLFTGILSGVQAAHDADLVHRDLKPANVLLERTRHGFFPKVTDFGLAKLLYPEPGTAHTRAGISMGTPSYMAPEQIRDAGSVDQRADMWSLGCLLYEIVTRCRAFPGRQALSIYNAVVRGDYEPPRNHTPNLPQRIVDAIAGCLQVDSPRRIPDCRTLHEVLTGSRSWILSTPPHAVRSVADDEWHFEWPEDEEPTNDLNAPSVAEEEPTQETQASKDAPLMPLVGSSSTGAVAPLYLPDDPPAVAGIVDDSLSDGTFGSAQGGVKNLPPFTPSEAVAARPGMDSDASNPVLELPRLEAAEVHDDDLVPLGMEDDLSMEDAPRVWVYAGAFMGLVLILSMVVAGTVIVAVTYATGGPDAWFVSEEPGVEEPVPEPAAAPPSPIAPAPSVIPKVDPKPLPPPRPRPVPSQRASARPRLASPPVAPPPAPRPLRDVVLVSFPLGARVFVDGEAAGRTPRKASIEEGKHQVTMQSGGRTGAFSIEVEERERHVWCYNFEDQTLYPDSCP